MPKRVNVTFGTPTDLYREFQDCLTQIRQIMPDANMTTIYLVLIRYIVAGVKEQGAEFFIHLMTGRNVRTAPVLKQGSRVADRPTKGK